MSFISTMTQKGQVTIPVHLRRKLRLSAHQKVVFIEKKGAVEVRRAVDFFRLRGSIQSAKKYSEKQADEVVGKYLGQAYAKKKKST